MTTSHTSIKLHKKKGSQRQKSDNFFIFRENLIPDCIKGCFVVACTMCAFISLVWLREQIVMNGGPAWLEPQEDNTRVVDGHINENLANDEDGQVWGWIMKVARQSWTAHFLIDLNLNHNCIRNHLILIKR